jgi:ABC-type phosphate/phosphonate transport system substrate-binding protein
LKVLLIIFLIAIMFLSIAYGDPNLQRAPGDELSLVVGYSSKVFSDVDIKDAQAATKVWTDMLVRKTGGSFSKSEAIIFNDLTALDNLLKAKMIYIVVLFSTEFVEIRTRAPLVPIFAADYGKYFFAEILLVVRKDSGISGVDDLKHKSLIIEIGQKGSISSLWIETLLMREGFGSPKEYFSNLKDATRASRAALPVFFRQAEACVVGRSNLETMIELNPQVGVELKDIARSPGYLTGVVCLRKDLYQKKEKIVSEALKALYTEPQGKQLMSLFRVNKLVPFKDEYLESVESLLREHRYLMVGVAQRE